MAQPFKQLLIDLAEDSEAGQALRDAWDDDPDGVGKERGLTNRQIGILIRSNLNEIQREANREAKEAGAPTKKAVVLIDR